MNVCCSELEIYTTRSRVGGGTGPRRRAASLRGIKWILYARRDDTRASWNKQLKAPSDDVDTSRGES